MVKKLLGLGALAGAALMLTGCLSAPVMPPYGIIYTDYKAPLDFDQENSMVGMKEGRAATVSYVGLVAMGDASIKAAAEDGGISTIYGADYEYKNIVGIIQNYTTIVYGE